MFIWKYLDIPEWNIIESELKSYIKNIKKVDVREPTVEDSTRLFYLDNTEVFYNCPAFEKYFSRICKNHNKIVMIKYSFPSGYNHVPHLDNAEYYNQFQPPAEGITKWSLGLNFPIENCENTYTAFYAPKNGQVNITKVIKRPDKPQWGVYRELDAEDLLEIDRYWLTKPILINTSVPHNVVNNSGKTRVAITVRLNPDPWELIG